MKIASAGIALPEHYYDQATVTARLKRIWAEHPDVVRRLDVLHRNAGVEGRHFALPIDEYETLENFGAFNDAWIRCAVELGERAVRQALERANLGVEDVDAIFFSTVTGLAAPSLDARLANRMGFRSDIKRVPMFGLGCVAGAAAVARAADYVRGHPDQVAVVLTVELCSLTWQREDLSIAHVISSGLFGDGAGAAVVVGSKRAANVRGPQIVDTRSVFYPDTENVMGWRVCEHGFRIILSPDVPSVARENIGRDVETFLRDHQLAKSDIRSWVCHPGGPKVLAAVRDALEVNDDDLALSWESLRRVGNLSSASVLLILEATIERARPAKGTRGMMLAMGPGFCSELLLLEW
jgi:alkylresorcinol/alkylpyrone synthase